MVRWRYSRSEVKSGPTWTPLLASTRSQARFTFFGRPCPKSGSPATAVGSVSMSAVIGSPTCTTVQGACRSTFPPATTCGGITAPSPRMFTVAPSSQSRLDSADTGAPR